jgi:hypothetical protein
MFELRDTSSPCFIVLYLEVIRLRLSHGPNMKAVDDVSVFAS